MKTVWIAAIAATCLLGTAAFAQSDSSRHMQQQTILGVGALVRIDDGHVLTTGTLVHPFTLTHADTVVLVRCNTCTRERIPGNILQSIAVGTGASRATHVAYGIAGGIVAGVSAGVLLGAHSWYGPSGGDRGAAVGIGAVLGAGAGALIGAALPQSLHWISLGLH